MKTIKFGFKEKICAWHKIALRPKFMFGNMLKMTVAEQFALPINFELEQKKKSETFFESAQNNEQQSNTDSIFVSRVLFERIKLTDTQIANSLEKVSNLFGLIEETDFEIFKFIASKLELEKHLSASAIKAYGFPLDRLNLLAMYFGFKFFISETSEPKKPVISIMGHVDHGKTTLLDFYRNSRKAENEVGGITQKIGGFNLETKFGSVAFIDTPGHAVFSNMRRTGAFLADIVVLIVSAIEGVQPQTIEVLNLIKEHNLPFIVAINKIDANGADPESVEETLVEMGIALEPYGGNIPVVHISAKTGQNLDLLLELLVEEAKALELKADISSLPECLVLETCLSQSDNIKRSSVVVKNGTLQVGQPICCGDHFFKVHKITNDLGKSMSIAKPGDIVEITGANVMPKSTEKVLGLPSDAFAKLFCEINEQVKERFFKEVSDVIYSEYKIKFADRRERRKFYGNSVFFQEKMKAKAVELSTALSTSEKDTADDLKQQIEGITFMLDELSLKDCTNPLLIKVGNMGTLDTVKTHLEKLDKKSFTLLEISCGQITEQDLKRCKQANAKIITFDIPKCPDVLRLVKQYEIDCINHDIIYKLFDDLKIITDTSKVKVNKNTSIIATATIKKVFTSKNDKGAKIKIAGCCVEKGSFKITQKYRISRDGKVIADNLTLSSMKRFKQEVDEIVKGQDTGLSFVNHNNIEEGDLIESYK